MDACALSDSRTDPSPCTAQTYNADKTVLIPGSGTYAMEAVARQYVDPASGSKPVVVRNGWFSFRWTEIFESMGMGEDTHSIMKAESVESPDGNHSYKPHAIEAVVAEIKKNKPPAVFMPHVETSTGMMVSDDYIKKVSAAAKEVGAVMVLDCIASGTCWVDMKEVRETGCLYPNPHPYHQSLPSPPLLNSHSSASTSSSPRPRRAGLAPLLSASQCSPTTPTTR